MNTFKYAHASAETWQEAVQACLAQMGELDTSPNLGFLYITDLLAKDFPHIIDSFKEATHISQWVGTVGVGICSVGKEYYDVPAIAVMLGQFPENSFQVFANLLEESENFSSSWCNDQQAIFSIVHGDPRNDRIANLVLQLSEQLNEGFLVGGLSSSRSLHFQLANRIVEGGLSGVLFSNAVEVTTRLTQGCTAIGPRRQITESENNIIIRIDNRPALDVFYEEIGEEFANDLKKVAGQIFAALPIVGSDTGDYLVRQLVGVDLKHKLIAITETVQPGRLIMFTRRDLDNAYQDMVKMLYKIKNHIAGRSPKGGLYYSCLGRGGNLFGDDSQELKIIQSVLGDLPLVGFFANGEISHQRLYSYTGILTLFL